MFLFCRGIVPYYSGGIYAAMVAPVVFGISFQPLIFFTFTEMLYKIVFAGIAECSRTPFSAP